MSTESDRAARVLADYEEVDVGEMRRIALGRDQLDSFQTTRPFFQAHRITSRTSIPERIVNAIRSAVRR